MTRMEAAALDQAVDSARRLCAAATQAGRPRGLPERSAMQNLLRFARGTDSPAEAVLFIRYQAARARPDERRFLVPLADQAEQHYGGDIDALRTFLGILVRAAQVTRAQAWQDASAPGPGRQAERR